LNSKLKIISSEKNWMEQSAINQLNRIAVFEGMRKIIGLPDLHPGKVPVGAAFITEDVIYPHIVSSDIGCGMSLFVTKLDKRKMKADKWISKLDNMGSLRDVAFSEEILDEIKNMPYCSELGTIGGGNHFAELQEVDTIFDQEVFDNQGLSKGSLLLLIHSGSRIYGHEILDKYIKKHSAQNGLDVRSEVGMEYLAEHDNAILWAKRNRELIAFRFLNAIGESTNTLKLVDSVHNSIEIKKTGSKNFYIHRKGAAPANNGITVIPGSRGALTYLVMPYEDTSISGYSIAHGAGRKWERNICKARLKNLYTKESIKTTKLKSKVICHNKDLLYEEAPEAYKNIEKVIESLVESKIIKVVSTLKPIFTYKN
jgi:release factor H-coupled RctB family protein